MSDNGNATTSGSASLPGIGSWLSARERLTPDKEALVEGNRRLTYAQLNRRVSQAARALLAMGLRPGDRFAILSPNRLEVVELIMAAARAGLVIVPLNVRLAAAELGFVLKDSGTALLVHDPAMSDLATASIREAGTNMGRVVLGPEDRVGAESYEALLARERDSEPKLAIAPTLETPHIIMYTAGTTGRPKGAVLSQGASFWNAVNLTLALDLQSSDRDLLLLPLFHVGGIGLFTLPMLYVGGTVILQRAFEPAEALRLVREEHANLLFGVPAIFLRLAGEPNFGHGVLDGVRVLMSGGAPLPRSLVERYAKQAGATLRQGFGMSEAAPSIATLRSDLALQKAGSVGRALMHVEARIVDETMRELDRGQVGELVIRGPNLMTGYWNRPDETREAFEGGFFHTGDLARIDGDGDIWIVDRKKDMFISGGENVYPAEVEAILYELPEVEEAAVVGVEDTTWGEVGRAVVVLKKGSSLNADAVRGHLAGRLARYKIPKQVVFSGALPRNAAGKVLKGALRGPLASLPA